MNIISISFEPLKRYAHIMIDGDRISPYSDLAICENKDLHVCGKRLLKLLDEEVGSEYKILVNGHQFQFDLLSALSEQSQLCVSVEEESPNLTFNMPEILEFAERLNSEYAFGIDKENRVQIGGDAAKDYLGETAIWSEEAEVYIVNQIPESLDKGKTVLLISDHFDIRNTRGLNIIDIPRESINTFIEYYCSFVKAIPFIEAVFSKSRYTSMPKTESLFVEAYTTQTPKYIFDISPTSIDVGETTEFQFRVIPPSASETYQLQIDRPSAVKITNNQLLALQDGIVTLSVVMNDGTCCEKKELLISKHNYVQSIRLVPSSNLWKVGEKGRIDAYILPEDAEDVNSIKWCSSNPDIVHISSSGSLIALKPGEATITVSAKYCSQQIHVTVCPALETITLTESTINVEAGASHAIECNVFPADAAPEELIWELSNDGMGTLNVSDNGKMCTFTATTSLLTKGTLTCRVRGSGKRASCTIEVIPEKKPTGLITSAIIFSTIGLIASFLIPILWFAGNGIAGFFADFCLPIGIILCLIGKAKTKEKIFGTMLILDLVVTGVMFFFAVTCCSPR